MSNDASAAAASPMTNGASQNGSHREADASTGTSGPPPSSLASVCADLHARVTHFLNAEPDTETLRRTQAQTRVAISVIEKALQDFEYVKIVPRHFEWPYLNAPAANVLVTASKHSHSHTMAARIVWCF